MKRQPAQLDHAAEDLPSRFLRTLRPVDVQNRQAKCPQLTGRGIGPDNFHLHRSYLVVDWDSFVPMNSTPSTVILFNKHSPPKRKEE